eukprot:scaffold86384_cov37-Prasinocladus_malaysianus.AAC.3
MLQHLLILSNRLANSKLASGSKDKHTNVFLTLCTSPGDPQAASHLLLLLRTRPHDQKRSDTIFEVMHHFELGGASATVFIICLCMTTICRSSEEA